MTETVAVNDLVEKYIRLREIKAKLKAKHDEEMAPVNDGMKLIEATLLTEFERNGAESIKTKAGTAYRSTRTSATVADWDEVLTYIRDNGLWELLERRVSKEAVKEFVEQNADLPPGVNWREEVTLGVRRS